ncbi:MAG: CPBP family intramembrane metalloprotease [Planctomycetota bacterium]|nr:CPBP family intramembrane metalloprotease [Planctomycetota bacterium]
MDRPRKKRRVPTAAQPPREPLPPHAEPDASTLCAGCRRTFGAQYKFCPHCGRGVAESEKHRRQLKRHAQVARHVHNAYADIRRMAVYYMIFLGLNFVSAYVIPSDMMWGLLLYGVVIICVSMVWWRQERGLDGRWSRPGFGPLAMAGVACGAFATYGLAHLNNQLALRLLGLQELMEATDGLSEFFRLQIPLPALIVGMCLVPGVFEELLFRGLIQATLEKQLSRREAWIVQAVVFAIAHVNLIGFFTYLVLMGLWLGWLRNRSNSIIPGMLAHFAHNLLAVLVVYYRPFEP